MTKQPDYDASTVLFDHATEAIRRLIPGAKFNNMTVVVSETEPDTGLTHSWSGSAFALADRIATHVTAEVAKAGEQQ